MAESTLSLGLADLAGEVGFFLGYGRGAPLGDIAWTSQQQLLIDYTVKSGLRQFYYPPEIQQGQGSYDWSFLKPVASLTFVIGTNTVQLPDDFGSPEGQITILSASTQVTWPIDITGEGRIRQAYSITPTSSGRPLLASVQVLKGTQPNQGTRFQLYIYPLADQTYTIQIAYYVNPDYLTTANPYHVGGMVHAETILESCLAIAEQRLDDSSSVHSMKFMERLQASVSMDRRLKPQLVGYNGDRSDRMCGEWQRRDLHGFSLVTVNGVQY